MRVPKLWGRRVRISRDRGVTMEGQRRRITLLDGHGLFTELIEQVLDRHGYRCRLVETGSSSSATIASAVLASHPEMVVASLDLHSTHSDGGAVLHALVKTGHRALAVLEGGGPSRHGQALALGAHAVAEKSMPLNEFLAMVRKTMNGEPVVDRLERTRLVALYREQRGGRAQAARQLESLSPQEREVLAHLMAGRGVREVATLRVVSEHTVRTQVRAVLTKLDVSSQVEAVALAWGNEWGASEHLRPAG
jgi:two-component system nitrate/nitrite response regulator NarL